MHLNRSQLSLIITASTLGIVVLTLFNIHLGATLEEEYVIEMSLEEEDLPELMELPEEEVSESDPVRSHMALNETAKPQYGDPEPLKTLEELLQEREALENQEAGEPYADNGDYAEHLKELARKREELKEQLDQQEAEKKEYTNVLKDRRTSISYSLVERNAHELPPPIYTCIEGGKVVINIEVDALGYVIQADFNAKSSGTSNGCLVENAIAYALKARFNPSSRSTQKGTITYLFQSK
ncbi:energy transducer TonB [Robiginitalea sediminis]|uniref:hypothetical protein n=1 Tax=Robiginitalea sediminis TaxID=1982593 RepID=UPI000B4BA9B3|nr:hypothetical protein [Robiginitalea sediminis]